MAEALAAVGVVASIVQLVDFSTKVVSRLDEFYSIAKEVPKSFRQVKTELPLLATTLEQLKGAIDASLVADGSKKALLPVIAGCNEQVAQLDAILGKTLPETNDSWRTKGKKAIVSLHHDAKVENITRALRNYLGMLTFYYAAAASTLQPLTDTVLCKIRTWLSAPDPSTNYQKALKLRQADTGLWFLESDTYTRWITNATSPLWLYGIPGCGKTILSSTVLQNMHQHCQGDPGKVIAYFFFDFNDSQKQYPEAMVRSLLCQISQQSIEIPASLQTLFSSNKIGQRQPSTHALLETLQSMIHELPQVYIMLDALDECAQRVELTDMLEMITGWKLQNLHLLVTSRKERDIESCLKGFVDDQNRVCLQSTVVDKDIQRYMRQRLSTDKDLHKWNKDAVIRDEIEDVLRDGAHGMFRWAVCQLDALGKCRNRVTLRKALATLPPTLDQTYDRILSSISEEDSEFAIVILRWLTFSARPLSVEELAEVVAIDVEREPAFDRDEVLEDPLDVLNICSSLVTLAAESDSGWRKPREFVALAHYSVKEYLLSDRIWTGKAARYGMRDDVCHDAIATSCLGYLMQFQQLELDSNFLELFRLAQYAAEFWIGHAQKTGERISMANRAALRLCSKESSTYINWIRLWDPDEPLESSDFQKVPEEILEPLYYAALSNLRGLVKLLLDTGADPNAQGGKYGNALQVASVRGYEAVVKLLLDKGANPNTQSGRFGSALYVASYGGHGGMVKQLLDKGAEVNEQDELYDECPLHAASERGYTQVVKLLLDNGADPNMQSGDGDCALYRASEQGHEQVVELLLENGTDPNVQGGDSNYALYVASDKGHEQIVRLLLDRGGDPNARSAYFCNALYAASARGYWQIVQVLLKGGANPNVQGGYYGNALVAASAGGYEQVVTLLLDQGADPNARVAHFGNALLVASLGGYEHVVRQLLCKGADPNDQGGHFNNALCTASSRGHETIVELLLDNGADINARNGSHDESALYTASERGHEQVVKMLLDIGADPNAKGGYYGNALQAAIVMGCERVVQLLLNKGAGVIPQGRQFGNALQVASGGGHKTIVRQLLDNGAEPNMQGGDGGYALYAASESGHDQIVKLLLDMGADPNAKGGYYNNALQAASFGGHKQVVKQLLDMGADPNAQGGHFGNALLAASIRGYEPVVDLLLRKGADPNKLARPFGSALYVASSRGYEMVVKQLLTKGADPNTRTQRNGENALHKASERGYEQVVKLLLDMGADPNAQGGYFCNALYAASFRGHEQVVKQLLDMGADPNAQGRHSSHPLLAAALGGHGQVVKLLLAASASHLNGEAVLIKP